ncbi:uncharacterized protein, partial [Littorina saxatilis]|uniref:uncharacterized protein n=1 Tax=Littorina saxatilis TaxID=31220 RepID=UPI0038B46AC2
MTKSWPDSCVGYMAFFGLVATFFRGCSTYTRRKVLHVPDQESLPEQKHELRNQLPINSTEEQTAFISVLREWRLIQRHKTSPSSGTLWMSKNLSEHLNLAVNTPRPPSITHQVFFMEAGLPAFLITIFKPDLGNPDKEKVRRYAVELLQHHSRMMKDFCPHPFIVLPLTMKAEDLTAEEIERRIKDETDRASYYSGPGDLSEAAYTSLKDGMDAVSAGTMVPYVLQDKSET